MTGNREGADLRSQEKQTRPPGVNGWPEEYVLVVFYSALPSFFCSQSLPSTKRDTMKDTT